MKIIFIIFFFILNSKTYGSEKIEAEAIIDNYQSTIEKAWMNAKPSLDNWSSSERIRDNTNALYYLENYTINYLIVSIYKNDILALRRLMHLYSKTFDALSTIQYRSNYKKGAADGAPKEYYIWKGGEKSVENRLNSAQFLYAIVLLAKASVKLNMDDNTARAYVRSALDVAINHYWRWINTGEKSISSGVRCAVSEVQHIERVHSLIKKEYSTNKKLSCNAVRDYDLWLIAGVSEVLVIWDKTSTNNKISMGFEKYVRLGVDLVKRRHVKKEAGRLDEVTAIFDPGGFKYHYDYRYAGYEMINDSCSIYKKAFVKNCSVFPGHDSVKHYVAEEELVDGVGWDIAHARRFVPVYMTLYEVSKILNMNFPSLNDIQQLARQIGRSVWNGDVEKPMFKNYMDGSNGWYRVNYKNRVGFGYPPFGRSDEFITFGFGFWSFLNADLKLALEATEKIYKDNKKYRGKEYVLWDLMVVPQFQDFIIE